MIPHAIKVSTGGSSGHPFTFYNMKENRAIEHGFITDMWSAFFPEITVKTKRTFLRGGIIDNGMEYDPLFGLKLSSRNINEDLAHQFIKAIDKYRFPIFHVYPSSLYILCQTMLKYGINRPKHFFNSINYGSEPLYEFQLELIQKIFNEPYSICYGSTEKVVLAGNCANSNNYHIYPQYGFTEIIKGNGDSAKEGELGEIIGTSFHNRVTPFIRYKTEDFAIVGGDKCEFCNRNYQLLNSIEGRLQEFVVSQNKTLVSMTCVAGSAHDETFNTIKQFRFEQREIGKVAFLFIPHDGQKVNTELLTKKLEDILGEKFHLTVRKVDKIDLTNAGKMSYLNQHLNINEFML